MERFGPQYCETPELITGVFPVEPWNAISSGVIVLFGIAALIQVMRRTPRVIEFYLLCVLLMTNGVGSILWHGLRTRWSLVLDVAPALIFVVFAAIAWARRVMPWWEIAAVGAGLTVLAVILRNLDLDLPGPGRSGAMIIVIVVAALWLSARSFGVSRAAALTGVLALVSASAALVFRSIDAQACASVPMGSHFLWHVFLSAGAFLCMTTLITLEAKRTAR